MAEHNQQFDSYDEWLAKAELWTRKAKSTEAPICFDSKGRVCTGSTGIMRARDDGAFPVRWLWPSQIPAIVTKAERMASAIVAGDVFDPAVDDFIICVPGLVARVNLSHGAA